MGLGGNITISIVKDDKGDQGIAISASGGGYGEALGAAIQGTRGTTTAISINELYGISAKVGVGINPGFVTGTYERIVAERYSGNYLSAGLGAGFIPLEFYGMATKTFVINLDDMIERLLHDFLGTPLPDDNLYGCED